VFTGGESMKRQTKRKVAALTLGSFLLLSMVSGCGAKEPEEQEQVVSTVPVEVQTMAAQNFDKVVTLGGLTAAESTVNVIAKVNGMEQIKAVNVEVGDKVTEGQILAQLDNESTQLSVNGAQIGVANAQNSIATAQQSYDNALTNYKNGQELFAVGAISQTDLDQLKLAKDSAESQLNAAQIGVSNAENNLASAQLALDYATVKAPISGTVTKVNADVGSYASASAPMFEIANVDTLEISTGINEQNVGKIHTGQEVLMKVDSVSDQWFSGSIKEISTVMDSTTKNYPIKISLRNQDEKLVAGMYAEINVVVDHVDNAIVIPVDAIVYKGTQTVAYVVQNDGTVQERQLTLGLNDGNHYVVTKGLQAGDKLVVKGNHNLVDGEAVTVTVLDGVTQDIIADVKADEESDANTDADAAADEDGADDNSKDTKPAEETK